MSNKIFLLPDHVANQIAAGEIAQRPSSVLKELLENAVDAKSTLIKAIIKKAGSTLIQIIDNGHGMNEIDAHMCFERHATSKIKTSKDLASIKTMGFRGEALASIAAVSQITLITKEQEQELATQIVLSGSTLKKQTLTTAPVGTNISIKNLFFNVPARRNFLKSPIIENKHIIEEFQRIALAHPKIAFELYQDQTPIYQLPSHKLAQRIVHLFGKNYQTKLLPCQATTNLIQVHGYTAPPKDAKKTRGAQLFFVNNRYIKSSYLNHAVKKAFEGLLAPNTFPFYILFIDIPPHHIDINVHPTKTEIKFQEENLVYGIIKTAIRKALATYHITPSLNFEQIEKYTALTSQKKASQEEINYSLFKTITTPTSKESKTLTSISSNKTKLTNQLNQPLSTNKDAIHALANKIQLHKKYIIAQVKSGMLLIDQRAAHERIIYERILKQTKQPTTTTQQLLLPIHITLQPADFTFIQACKKEIHTLGLQFTIQPPNKITLTALPPEASNQDPQKLFEELLEQYKCYDQEPSIPETQKWARSMAKRTRPNEQAILSNLEIETLIEQLFSCQNPNYTPSGKRIWVILTLEELAHILDK